MVKALVRIYSMVALMVEAPLLRMLRGHPVITATAAVAASVGRALADRAETVD